MSRKKQKWNIGDVFLVETSDGKYVAGQIIGREAEALNSVSVAFFDSRVTDTESVRFVELDPRLAFSIVFATREALDSGDWQIVDNRKVSIPPSMFPEEDKRSKGWVGARIRGSGILDEFLNAFYGLSPWDDWADPNYLDGLLVSPSKKPSNLKYKSEKEE